MIERLKKRQDFVQAARAISARSWATKGCVVQVFDRADEKPARIGFTVTKKLGNAVHRNRIRRRLKEAVRLHLTTHLKTGMDYVVIGRAGGQNRPFEQLRSDIINAVDRLNNGQTQKPYNRKKVSHYKT